MESTPEKIFFEERAVKVTNTRLVLPGNRTFAMSGVTAVRMSQTTPNRLGPAIGMLLGLGILYNSGLSLAALLFFAAGLVWYFLQKTSYYVVLTTSSGEQQALEDNDLVWVSNVVAALNESIVYRG